MRKCIQYTAEELVDLARLAYAEKGVAALSFESLKALGIYFQLYKNGIKQRDLFTMLGVETESPEKRRRRVLDEFRIYFKANREAIVTGKRLSKTPWGKRLRRVGYSLTSALNVLGLDGEYRRPKEVTTRIKKSIYSNMTDEQLIKFLKDRFTTGGFEAVSYPGLRKENGLYWALWHRGFKQRRIIELLNIQWDYNEYRRSTFVKNRDGKILRGWSWKRIVDETTKIVEVQGFLPAPAWFNENGFGSLVQAVYVLGKTWADLREIHESFQRSTFVKSRCGVRWLSRPEACFSNFLFSRGIEHDVGDYYPKDYAEKTGLTYGKYDIKFRQLNGERIQVEIWGDKPKGHDAARYAMKRDLKEKYNEGNSHFLGLSWQDCLSDKKLEKILEPYIGLIAPFRFEKEWDEKIQTVHWSNADELIAYCRELLKEMPDGRFPTEGWLRKRGRWKNRPGRAYNQLSWYIARWIGGMRNLRSILNQKQYSTKQWTRETALDEYRKWYERFSMAPSTTSYLGEHGKIELSESDRKYAKALLSAVRKYVGSTYEVHRILGIPMPVRFKKLEIKQGELFSEKDTSIQAA